MSEILAPAGGEEQLLAAVRCGAGAVYLGTGGFNARRNAKNFDSQTLPEAVRYCHERGVRLYVTVNTLVMDDELEALEEEAAMIAASGADAVIIQDMAVLRLFAGRYPGLERYASTQTAVHNVDGARRLADMGYDGIVLARELSLGEMEKICGAVSVRKEAFVHGAHCMSLSGGCYLSGMLGGRSGNRGLCAQPCRLDWHCGEKDHCLSMKDMSLLDHVRDMAAVGIDSFKIEGRMKRPEYVAAAVTACRRALAGEEYDRESLRAVFSRSGFTDGYLCGKRDGDMFGYRTKEDVTDGEAVLKQLRQLYHKETALVPLAMDFSLTGDGGTLAVSDGKNRVEIPAPVPQAALHRALDVSGARDSLCKTGGTPYYVEQFRGVIEPGWMLPASALNGLRRQAIEALDEKRGALPKRETAEFVYPAQRAHRAEKQGLWARFYEPEQICRPEALDKILLPAEKIRPETIQRFGEKLIAQLPTLLFPEAEERFNRRLEELRDWGLQAVETQNIYGLEPAKRLGLTVWGGFGLNVTNGQALDAYAREGLAGMTLSFEPGMERLKRIGGELPRGIAAYGHLPLMHWRNCPVRQFVGCSRCGGKESLRDRRDIEFPVECGQKQYSVLLNSVPLHIAERDLTGFDWLLLYFTREDPAQIRAVMEDFLQKRKAAGARTGGLYYRELL